MNIPAARTIRKSIVIQPGKRQYDNKHKIWLKGLVLLGDSQINKLWECVTALKIRGTRKNVRKRRMHVVSVLKRWKFCVFLFLFWFFKFPLWVARLFAARHRSVVSTNSPIWMLQQIKFCDSKRALILPFSLCISVQKPKQKRGEFASHRLWCHCFRPILRTVCCCCCSFSVVRSLCVWLVLHCIHWSRFIWAESTTRTLYTAVTWPPPPSSRIKCNSNFNIWKVKKC